MSHYYAIQCVMYNGAERYFCYYAILDEMEIRMVKEVREAIFYNESEMYRAVTALHGYRNELGIRKYNVIRLR